MNILITGYQGYVGSVLVPFLRSNCPGFNLVGYDNGYFNESLIDGMQNPGTNLDWSMKGDLRTSAPLLASGFDAVIHLASISNDPMGDRFAIATKEINLDSTVKLGLMARSAGVKKFIFASSCSMYGSGDESPRDENSKLDPLTEYAKSKAQAEKELLAMSDRLFRVYPLRFATACGSSARTRFDLVLNDFVASALTTGKINVLSDGTPWRPMIHVIDMCRAILWALFDEQFGGNYPLNVGSNENVFQVKDIAAAVAKETGAEVSMNTAAQPDKRSYKVDFSLFKRLAPQFYPVISLDEAIKDVAAFVKSVKDFPQDFRSNPNFIRLKALELMIEKNVLDDKLKWVSR